MQLVNGELVEHAYAPDVSLDTGKIGVKTLGFSAYVVAAAPIVVPVAPPPPPNITTMPYEIVQTPRPVQVRLSPAHALILDSCVAASECMCRSCIEAHSALLGICADYETFCRSP